MKSHENNSWIYKKKCLKCLKMTKDKQHLEAPNASPECNLTTNLATHKHLLERLQIKLYILTSTFRTPEYMGEYRRI